MKESVEVRAFPSELAESVQSVLPLLVDGQLHPPSEGFRAEVRGEFLEIPYRVYYRAERVRDLVKSAGEGVIVACLGARHYDGYLREECLTRVLSVEAAWVVPFVVQLVGEYVVSILQIIERAMPTLREALYVEYVSKNRSLFETVGRRAVSYWDVYHRGQYPKLSDYPGFRIHSELRRMSEAICATDEHARHSNQAKVGVQRPLSPS
jgi:hypothetical protein